MVAQRGKRTIGEQRGLISPSPSVAMCALLGGLLYLRFLPFGGICSSSPPCSRYAGIGGGVTGPLCHTSGK
jgi:hypothetical protein